jgi:hypothetical protein
MPERITQITITKENEGDGDFWIADTGEDARAVWTLEDAKTEAGHMIKKAGYDIPVVVLQEA